MNVTTLNTTTLDGNVIIKKGGGGTPTPPGGGEDWYDGYYLLDWENIHKEEGYDKEMAKEYIKSLDMGYYFAYVMPSGVSFTTSASFMDEENWWLGIYRAMRWKHSETSMDAEFRNLSPKELFETFGAEYNFLKTMADRMTPCTKEEFEALITM